MQRNGNPTRAFTLVELLAVIVIIALLAGMTTTAMSLSVQSAKESKTRGTILKLDVALQEIFESYEQKYETISLTTAQLNSLRTQLGIPSGDPIPDDILCRVKLHFIRDMMRMEMPVDWTEVNHNNVQTPQIPIGSGANAIYIDRPGVAEFYRTAYDNIGVANIDTRLASAELLFLIVMNLNPEALGAFVDSEIGDYDGNGLFEFHDAWGNPIQFLRWAPAFAGSDKQPDVITMSNYHLGTGDNTVNWKTGPINWDALDSTLSSVMQNAVAKHHDPFDGERTSRSWFLYPLVFSAGPDQRADIYMAAPTLPASMTWSSTNQPILDPFVSPLGIPSDTDENGELNHLDNIHNHRISGGF